MTAAETSESTGCGSGPSADKTPSLLSLRLRIYIWRADFTDLHRQIAASKVLLKVLPVISFDPMSSSVRLGCKCLASPSTLVPLEPKLLRASRRLLRARPMVYCRKFCSLSATCRSRSCRVAYEESGVCPISCHRSLISRCSFFVLSISPATTSVPPSGWKIGRAHV